MSERLLSTWPLWYAALVAILLTLAAKKIHSRFWWALVAWLAAWAYALTMVIVYD